MKFTEADYLAELDHTMNAKPPPQAFTVYQAAKNAGKSGRDSVRARLEKDVDCGKLQSEKFHLNGRVVRYYWLAKGGAKK